MNLDSKIVYVVKDTETKEFYETYGGKFTWNTPAAAKNAWNVKQALREPKFSEQIRMKVLKARVVLVEADSWEDR